MWLCMIICWKSKSLHHAAKNAAINATKNTENIEKFKKSQADPEIRRIPQTRPRTWPLTQPRTRPWTRPRIRPWSRPRTRPTLGHDRDPDDDRGFSTNGNHHPSIQPTATHQRHAKQPVRQSLGPYSNPWAHISIPRPLRRSPRLIRIAPSPYASSTKLIHLSISMSWSYYTSRTRHLDINTNPWPRRIGVTHTHHHLDTASHTSSSWWSHLLDNTSSG